MTTVDMFNHMAACADELAKKFEEIGLAALRDMSKETPDMDHYGVGTDVGNRMHELAVGLRADAILARRAGFEFTVDKPRDMDAAQ